MTEITIKTLMDESFEILKKIVDLDSPSTVDECSECIKNLSHIQTLNISYFISISKTPIPCSDRIAKELREKFESIPEVESAILKKGAIRDDKDTDNEYDPHFTILMSISRIMHDLAILASTLDSIIDKDGCEHEEKLKKAAAGILEDIDLDSIRNRMRFISEDMNQSEIVH